MRRILDEQLPLVPRKIDHVHARELAQMSAVLDAMPETLALIQADLLRRQGNDIDATKGRDGMTAEQVLRALVIKKMNSFSYEELSFHLADSVTYRSFYRLGIDQKSPQKSTLQKNLKRIRPETWKAINRHLLHYAAEKKIETGDKTRIDSTAVKTNIHDPTDSSLLWDCVRVLARLMNDAEQKFRLKFKNRSRRAKRRALGILNAKSKEARLPLYRDLLGVTEETVKSAVRIATELDEHKTSDIGQAVEADVLAHKLRHYVEMANRVIEQTQRRVLREESVPATEKIVSIFEPHTDIIVKKRRETQYGHKIFLTTGASGLVTDIVVEKGNPADSTLAVKMIERQRELYGKTPRQASFDGGFTSASNLAAIKELGVEDVAFSKGRGLSLTDMVKNSWVYRRLRNFRAGIEGTISFLKRVFGLRRCTWSSFRSFKAYVYAAVLACNLLVVARHLLSAAA